MLSNKPNFREVCFDEHGFTLKSFDLFVNTAKTSFKQLLEAQAWDDFVNIVASVTAMVGAFPERAIEF